MADKHIDIFKSLKNFQVKPPNNFFTKIWRALAQHGNLSEVPSFLSKEEEEFPAGEKEVFRSLQNYSIVPPAFSMLNFKEDAVEIIGSPKKEAKIIRFKYPVRAAAAILLIACSVWVIYFAAHTKQQPGQVALTNHKITPSASDNTSVPANPVNDVQKRIKSTSKQPYELARAKASNKNAHVFALSNSNKQNAHQHIKAIGTQLQDNDILLTLVSYHYKEYAPLLSQIEKNQKLTLDQFSYVSISDKMNDILRKMYTTKRNNRPTRKARKLKAKLEKWKKADEKYFDTGADSNPLDIIDLSEFILK